jgi:WG containing repeat
MYKILFLLILSFPLQLQSQNLTQNWKAQFDEIGDDFYENRIWVKKNDKWGFVDSTGKVIVPLIYDGARRFYEGMA